MKAKIAFGAYLALISRHLQHLIPLHDICTSGGQIRLFEIHLHVYWASCSMIDEALTTSANSRTSFDIQLF